MERRKCCCGCGLPAVHIVGAHPTHEIDLGFSVLCKDKHDAVAAHFADRCERCQPATEAAK